MGGGSREGEKDSDTIKAEDSARGGEEEREKAIVRSDRENDNRDGRGQNNTRDARR